MGRIVTVRRFFLGFRAGRVGSLTPYPQPAPFILLHALVPFLPSLGHKTPLGGR